MSDEARLIVELQDKSGGGSGAYNGQNTAGPSAVPGSDYNAGAQAKITAEGAGASAGAGSYTPGPVSTPIITTPRSEENPDPQLNLVRDILRASPQTTAAELGDLGIKPNDAERLLKLAKGEQADAANTIKPSPVELPTPYTPGPTAANTIKPSPVELPTPYTPGPTAANTIKPSPVELPTPYTPGPTATDATLAQFADQVRRNTRTPQEEFEAQKKRLDEALAKKDEIGFDQDTYDRAIKAAEQRRDRQLESMQGFQQVTEEPSAVKVTQDLFHATRARDVLNMFGPVGSAVGGMVDTALSSAQTLESYFKQTSKVTIPAATIAEVPAAAAPIAQTVAAVNTITAAVETAVDAGVAANAALYYEAERARSIVRDYSPAAAAAEANAEVRQIQADIATAEMLGGEVAQYVNNTSRLSAASQGLRDVVAKPFLQSYNDFTGGLAAAAEGANQLAKDNPQIASASAFLLERAIVGMAGGLGQLYDAIGLFGKLNQKKEDEENNSMKWFDDDLHLDLPEPFGSGKMAMPRGGADFSSMPGL